MAVCQPFGWRRNRWNGQKTTPPIAGAMAHPDGWCGDAAGRSDRSMTKRPPEAEVSPQEDGALSRVLAHLLLVILKPPLDFFHLLSRDGGLSQKIMTGGHFFKMSFSSSAGHIF